VAAPQVKDKKKAMSLGNKQAGTATTVEVEEMGLGSLDRTSVTVGPLPLDQHTPRLQQEN